MGFVVGDWVRVTGDTLTTFKDAVGCIVRHGGGGYGWVVDITEAGGNDIRGEYSFDTDELELTDYNMEAVETWGGKILSAKPIKQDKDLTSTNEDVVEHPNHYTSHPSGVECIEIVKHFSFPIGSAIKYLWRAGLKGDAVQDLKKAIKNIEFEIEKRESSK
ncbi:DUF3310 domain-containing protein [Streptomyces sp. NPDC004732]|uniref:DUF3310 domain-containing protein n=1 Tax=Streptomyces sp. NPDC004732 TaxID=3154290 RepID=UPI0033B3A27D